jgi:hypothetical protein
MLCNERISSVERYGFISVEKHPIGEALPGENPVPPWRQTPEKYPDAKSSTSSQLLSHSGQNKEQLCLPSIAFRLGRIHLLTERDST